MKGGVDRLMKKTEMGILSFLWFPFCRGEAGLVVTPINGYFCNLFPLLHVVGLFLHFSSSSAFLRYLFTQSSHLCCGLPRFLQPSCFFVSDIFGNISSFILTMQFGRCRPTLIVTTVGPIHTINFCQKQ